MQAQRVHSLILGAGPSGLAAGYMLAKAGAKPVVLEKDKVPRRTRNFNNYSQFSHQPAIGKEKKIPANGMSAAKKIW